MASVFKRGGKNNRGGYWYVSWSDHSGRRRSKCTRTTDKATAQRIGDKLETEAAKRREGLIDPQLESFAREARRPLAELVAEYKAKLTANGCTPLHVNRTVGFVEAIAAHAEFTTAADISPEGVHGYVGSLQDLGKAARTIHAKLTAIKAFTRWLAEGGKVPRDPLASVRKPNPQSDRKLRRRMLLPEEWPHLLSATLGGPERGGMPGAERALLYRLALATGLRAGELRSLTRASIVLDATSPYIRVWGPDTKNGKAAQQFIDRELADALREHAASKTPSARLFALPDPWRMAQVLRDDLEAARDKWIDDANRDPEERTKREQSDFLAAKNHAGEALDFHALRHTAGAWLSLSGAHPKAVQAFMRHSTIVLTMDAYGHLLPNAEAETAAQLGAMVSLSGPSPPLAGKNILRMTGTAGPDGAQRQAQQSGRRSVQRDSAVCIGERETAVGGAASKSLPLVTLGDVLHDEATASESSPGRIRTCDQGIMSPLL
jgi:integrase